MNKVILIGNLTRDVETRKTQSGKTVTNLTIAVTRPLTTETDFFSITVWDKQAENCAKFLKKGNKVGIVGYVFTRSYEDKDGVKRNVTEINANEVEFLTPKQPEDQEEAVTIKRHPLTEIDDNRLPF